MRTAHRQYVWPIETRTKRGGEECDGDKDGDESSKPPGGIDAMERPRR
jgi:hypothetical protein